jgi:hypothetical protein
MVMKRSELILEYLKLFVWPVLIIVLVLVFRNPIISVLDSGDIELDILGVKLKGSKANMKQVDDLKRKEATLQENLNILSKDIENLHAIKNRITTENLDLKNRLDKLLLEKQKSGINVKAIREQLSKEVVRAKEDAEASNQVYYDAKQRVAQSQKLVNEPKFQTAKKYETSGFQNLVKDRFKQSLENFENAYKAYPEYHNVEEISKLLRKNIEKLNDSSRRDPAKINIYRQILESYSWGVPDDIKEAMQRSLALNDPEYIRSIFKGSQRKKASDMIAELGSENPVAVVKSLIAAILPAPDNWSYRVNLNISRTLALIKPDWYGTREQYHKFSSMNRTGNYQDQTFKKWVDQAKENYRVLTITLEKISLKKAGDMLGRGHIFFEIKIADQSPADLSGFPTRKTPLRLSDGKPHSLNNLAIRSPQFRDQDFWPVKLSIRVWDNDPTKSKNELTALFEMSIDKNQIGKKLKLNSVEQDKKFPDKNGELTLSIRQE